eukprot:7237679-Prymnesium_polylepis.1
MGACKGVPGALTGPSCGSAATTIGPSGATAITDALKVNGALNLKKLVVPFGIESSRTAARTANGGSQTGHYDLRLARRLKGGSAVP